MHRGLLGGGARAVDADVVAEHVLGDVPLLALVVLDQATRAPVADLRVGVGLVGLVVGLGVRIGLGILLAQPLREGLALGLLPVGVAEPLGDRPVVGCG